jgi:hypothetical protein
MGWEKSKTDFDLWMLKIFYCKYLLLRAKIFMHCNATDLCLQVELLTDADLFHFLSSGSSFSFGSFIYIRGWCNRPVVAAVPKVPQHKLQKKLVEHLNILACTKDILYYMTKYIHEMWFLYCQITISIVLEHIVLVSTSIFSQIIRFPWNLIL